ncbi:hypothetical protein, partial [Neisseria meningitidis]|uniref:hypothetical protein n=1 Tax=Neisseria meningitidis TaxID=487 RepID=UPI001C9DB450
VCGIAEGGRGGGGGRGRRHRFVLFVLIFFLSQHIYLLCGVFACFLFNFIFCVFFIKLIIYSCLLVRLFCTAPAVPLSSFFILLFLKGIKISDMLMSFHALI